PKPGFEDEPEPGEEKREPASGTTKKKAKFGTRSAAISSYDNLDDESEPSNGFPTWLGVAAVAAAVLAVVLITGRDARNSAQASSSDAGLRMAQPSIGTPLLPIAEDAATVSPPKTVAVAVA